MMNASPPQVVTTGSPPVSSAVHSPPFVRRVIESFDSATLGLTNPKILLDPGEEGFVWVDTISFFVLGRGRGPFR